MYSIGDRVRLNQKAMTELNKNKTDFLREKWTNRKGTILSFVNDLNARILWDGNKNYQVYGVDFLELVDDND